MFENIDKGVYEIQFIDGYNKHIGFDDLVNYLLSDGWSKKQIYILIDSMINEYKIVEFKEFKIRRLDSLNVS